MAIDFSSHNEITVQDVETLKAVLDENEFNVNSLFPEIKLDESVSPESTIEFAAAYVLGCIQIATNGGENALPAREILTRIESGDFGVAMSRMYSIARENGVLLDPSIPLSLNLDNLPRQEVTTLLRVFFQTHQVLIRAGVKSPDPNRVLYIANVIAPNNR